VRRGRVAPPQIPVAVIVTYRRILFAALEKSHDEILRRLAKRLAQAPTEKEAREREDAKSWKTVKPDVDPIEIALIFQRVSKKTETETKRLIGIPSTVSVKSRDAFIAENVDLVESLGDWQLDELAAVIELGFQNGDDVRSIRADIEDRFEVSRSKADLLARDQVLKLNGKLTKERQTRAGIKEYVWSTSGDERVREMHAELDGETFSWDDPPVTNEDGDENAPGGDYSCRCVAVPIIPEDFDDEESDEDEDAA
jgi:SPP1 gp7 family putative phage head morphogenesis protein